MKSSLKTLDNGVRLITVPMKDNPAVTVMALAASGSNNDPDGKQGIAHFLEHMVMKGGEKYPGPYDVSATLDAIGAESNAMTGHEFTGYFAKGHPKHLSTMLDVIADVYRNASIDGNELEKERGVIAEEINMIEDMPMAHAMKAFQEVMYGDQPAGWHTLGTKETTGALTRNDFLAFKNKHYVGKNTIVIAAGDFDKKQVTDQVTQQFGDMPASRAPKRKKPTQTQQGPGVQIEQRETDQAHLAIGVHAYKASDKRLPALKVLNAVLGGGMSSRLFQQLREEMGVCYYVRSRVGAHDTYGHLAIMAGVDTKRLGEVVEKVMDEVRRMRDEPVGKKELQKAKDYLIGHTFLELEESEGVADFFLEQEVMTGEQKTPNQVAKEIRAVTAEDVQKVAKDIFKNNKLNMAAVGNVKNESSLKKTLEI